MAPEKRQRKLKQVGFVAREGVHERVLLLRPVQHPMTSVPHASLRHAGAFSRALHRGRHRDPAARWPAAHLWDDLQQLRPVWGQPPQAWLRLRLAVPTGISRRQHQRRSTLQSVQWPGWCHALSTGSLHGSCEAVLVQWVHRSRCLRQGLCPELAAWTSGD